MEQHSTSKYLKYSSHIQNKQVETKVPISCFMALEILYFICEYKAIKYIIFYRS